MSLERFRFKVKRGEIEIEYEGSSVKVSSKFLETFEWLKATPLSSISVKPEGGVQSRPTEKETDERRGGARAAVISPAIDDLIKEGFLNDFKNTTQVLEELRRKTVPVSGIKPVDGALTRKVPKILDRIKDEKGRWVYRKKA